jgi:hypothetical protein
MRAITAANDSLPSFHDRREDRQEKAATTGWGHWLTTSQHKLQEARVQAGVF